MDMIRLVQPYKKLKERQTGCKMSARSDWYVITERQQVRSFGGEEPCKCTLGTSKFISLLNLIADVWKSARTKL